MTLLTLVSVCRLAPRKCCRGLTHWAQQLKTNHSMRCHNLNLDTCPKGRTVQLMSLTAKRNNLRGSNQQTTLPSYPFVFALFSKINRTGRAWERKTLWSNSPDRKDLGYKEGPQLTQDLTLSLLRKSLVIPRQVFEHESKIDRARRTATQSNFDYC